MIKHIFELDRQAQEYAAMELATVNTGGMAEFNRLYRNKFAELIVQECARIARATPCPYEEDEVRQRLGHTWDMASLEAGRGIVKHFGVEE